MRNDSHNGAGSRLRLLLGDQLSPDIATLRHGDRRRDVILMAEVDCEATYVPHHKKKIAFIFSAMRHFAAELSAAGWKVDMVRLGQPRADHRLCDDRESVCRRLGGYPHPNRAR